MSRLEALQAALHRAIRGGDGRAAAAALRGDGLPAAQRLQIHANHFRLSLREALAATYPVVARLVGPQCFAGLAREFALLSPPKSPRLADYGAGFARYLAAVPTLMALPYLPDVARLEWAVNAARGAAEAAPLPPAALDLLHDTAFASSGLVLHPAAHLLASPYPVDRIWQANQPDADPEAPVRLDQGPVRLLVLRDSEGDVAWCRLPVGDFAFLQALAGGATLTAAWNRASADDAAFDGGRSLAGLLAAGAFSDIGFPATRPQR